MAQAAAGSIVRQIESLFEEGSITGLSDTQLLQRFIDRRDAVGEAVFAALIARHGPMVLKICLQSLGDRQHAEDAFQAVFLVLARKARSIRDPNLLGAWLYGVALRTAQKAKVRNCRQTKREQSIGSDGLGLQLLVDETIPSADEPAMAHEQAEILHDEIDRLPRPFRMAIVLCYFDGLTLDEAARRLRWPAGTLRSRLARAREKLRRGLTRRGVALSAAALTEALSSRSASVAITPHLCNITTRAAKSFTAGHATRGIVSASVCALAQEVLRAMLFTRLRLVTLTLFVLAAVATGVGVSSQSLAGRDKPEETLIGLQREVAARPKDRDQAPAPGRMFVVGRVLNPEGKPVPNATVMVSARAKSLGLVAAQRSYVGPTPMGHTTTDGSGLFRLDTPRTSSSGHEMFGAFALALGYGAAWLDLDPDAGQPRGEITLRPEQVIQGRLFDVHGRPAAGVEVAVQYMGRVLPREMIVFSNLSEGRLASHIHGMDLPAWPRPTTTDAEGRFTMSGVGRGLHVIMLVHDQRFARQFIPVDTNDTPGPRQLTTALEPARIIKGRVIYADTAKPVPHARLWVNAHRNQSEVDLPLNAEFETDEQGRFRVNPCPGDTYFVRAFPPAGQYYLLATKSLEWPKGAVEQSLKLTLNRGVVIRGKVTEERSGKPVKEASLAYLSYNSPEDDSDSSNESANSSTGPDGFFQFAALARHGHLIVQGPSNDYVQQDVGQRMVTEGQPGGRRFYSHAIIALRLQPGDTEKEVNVALHRGVTLKGELVGPDGHPAPETWVFGRGNHRALGAWSANRHGIARDGHFELHGLDSDTRASVYFLDPIRKLGTTYSITGRSAANAPVVVRLEPCGAAKARLVTPGGQPVAGTLRRMTIAMVVTPGAPFGLSKEKSGRLLADQDVLTQIDPINYGKGLASDAEGRITLPVLIPGATYRIIDFTTDRDPAGPHLRREFTVNPGETLDLGDILIEKPLR